LWLRFYRDWVKIGISLNTLKDYPTNPHKNFSTKQGLKEFCTFLHLLTEAISMMIYHATNHRRFCSSIQLFVEAKHIDHYQLVLSVYHLIWRGHTVVLASSTISGLVFLMAPSTTNQTIVVFLHACSRVGARAKHCTRTRRI
jgi:hypothetical protein